MRIGKPTREKLHNASAAGLRAIRMEMDEFGHPFHFHPEMEILYVEASKGNFLIGNRIASFEPQQLYVLGSNLPHLFRNTGPMRGKAKAEILQFPVSILRPFLEATGEFQGVVRLLDGSLGGLRFTAETARRSRSMIRKIRTAHGPQRWLLFLEMLDLLSRDEEAETLNHTSVYGPVHARYPEAIRKSCEAILTGFSGPLSHSKIAAGVGMSPSAFSRSFRQSTRRTFTDFVNEVRLGHAARLLLETQKPITEIAYTSGYSNIAHFNRQFRRFYQCTPRAYRKRV